MWALKRPLLKIKFRGLVIPLFTGYHELAWISRSRGGHPPALPENRTLSLVLYFVPLLAIFHRWMQVLSERNKTPYVASVVIFGADCGHPTDAKAYRPAYPFFLWCHSGNSASPLARKYLDMYLRDPKRRRGCPGFLWALTLTAWP